MWWAIGFQKNKMAYRSTLSAVLLLRTLHEEDAFREWAIAKDSLIHEEERLHQMNERLRETLEDLAERQRAFISSDDMTLYFRFIGNLREAIAYQKKIVAHQEAVCEEKRGLLEIAVKERKIVERIEEKRRSSYFTALLKKEQAQLDEISGQRQWRCSNEV